jgi:hypothetical protein
LGRPSLLSRIQANEADVEPECKESQGAFQQFIIEKSGLERTDIMYDFKPMSYFSIGMVGKARITWIEFPASTTFLSFPFHSVGRRAMVRTFTVSYDLAILIHYTETGW